MRLWLWDEGSWVREHLDTVAVIGLAVGALVLMSPYLLRPDVLIWPRSGLGTDFLSYRWSHVYHLRRSLRVYGQVPLWRGAVSGGEPMIGNPAVMLFYPLQLVIVLLPLPLVWSFALQTALHLWIAGLGTYVLTRHVMGVRRPAAFVGALAMMLTPRLSSNAVGDVGLDYAMCWVPFCLAWTRLALDRRRWTWAILAGMGLAFQFLIHVHVFFLTVWVIGLYFLYHLLVTSASSVRSGGVRRMAREWAESAGLLGLTLTASGGLAAFELLPFLTYLPYLSRQAMTLAEANHYALPPLMLVSVVMPSALKFPEWELYVGLLPLALMPLAALSPRRAESGFWAGLAAFAAIFSLGQATPLFPFLFHWIPGFRWLRVPARMWYYLALAAAALTSLAVDALAQPSTRARLLGRGWRHWLLAGGGGLILATVAGRWLTRLPGESDWILGLVGSLGLVLGLAGVWLWAHGRIGYATLGLALVGGLLLDLLPVDAAYMTPLPVEQVFQVPPVGRRLLEAATPTPAPFRIYAVRGELPPHVVTRHGWEVVGGINSFQFEPYVEFIEQATGCTLPGFAASMPPCSTNEISPTAYLEAIPNPVLLGLFNVRYVIAPLELEDNDWELLDTVGDERLYENRAVLPRAFGLGRVEVMLDRAALWRRLAQVDVRRVALVEAGEPPPRPLPNAFHVPSQRLDYRPNRIEVEIEMPDEGLLVLGEVWTPGWRATDNGRPVEVLRVDGALRGVYLAAGPHRVVFRFTPPAFLLGGAVSALGVVGSVLLLARRAGARRARK